MIIISPVTSWDSTSEAAIENEQYDTISRKFLEKAGAYHRNECPPNAYLEPLLADAEWWRDCKVEKILVAAGDKETLYGSIIEWLKIFEVIFSSYCGSFSSKPLLMKAYINDLS